MRTYSDGELVVQLVRCPADRYIINNMNIVQSAIANKQLAQTFLDSWARLRGMEPRETLDVDFYKNKTVACKYCIYKRNGSCRKVENFGRMDGKGSC